MLVLVALALAPGRAGGAVTTYSTGDGGAKVLYRLLDDLGYQVRRVFDFDAVGEDTRVLFHLSPSATTPGDELLRWTREGHLLVVALPVFTMMEGEDSGYCKDFRLGSLVIKRGSSGASSSKRLVQDDLSIRPSSCVLKVPSDARVLVGSDEEAIVVDVPLGEGRMLVLAHDGLLTNDSLHRDDLVVALRRWIFDHAEPRSEVAFFEEAFGGFNLMGLLRKTNLQLFVLHGLVWLLLLFWSLLPRSGDPRAVTRVNRREFSQHARALGHLYQRQRASVHALKLQYERFLSRVVGCTDQAAGVERRRRDREALATLVATKTGREPEYVESILAQVEYTVGSTDATRDTRDIQRHYRLSQALASMQRGSARTTGGKRGRTKVR